MNKDTLCSKRWNYASINLMQSSSTTCCLPPFIKITDEDIKKHGTDVFVNSEYLRTRRYEMFKGIRHNSCKDCWKPESVNAPSMRGNNNLNFCNEIYDKRNPTNIPLETYCNEIDENNELLYSNNIDLLEISIGTTCDLKCVYCSHHSSSQWALEKYNLGQLSKEDFKKFTVQEVDPLFEETFWKWFDTIKHNLKHVNIKGGEPLIIPYFYKIMEKLIEQSNNELNFDFAVITNMSTDNDARLDMFFDYIIKLQERYKVNIYISMESVNNRAEYIRSNLKWNQFERNVRRLVSLLPEYKNISVSFMPTINFLSVSSLPWFLHWVISLIEEYKIKLTCKTNMEGYMFSPLMLPSQFAEYTAKSLDLIDLMKIQFPENKDWTDFYTYIQKIHNVIAKNKDQVDHENIDRLYKFLDSLDSIRNTDWQNVFPELKNLK